LVNGPKNAFYTSGRIQNELILSLSSIVLRKLSDKFQNKLVSIIADETKDCGHHEQMSVVLRFFDDETNSSVEHLVGFTRTNFY